MKRVLGLTAIEAPFRSRLIETQFFEPLTGAFGSSRKDWQLTFLSAIPAAYYLGRRDVGGQLTANISRQRQLNGRFLHRGITPRSLLVPYPLRPRQFNLNKSEAGLFAATALPGLIAAMLCSRPDLIIARSYPAALLAYWAKRILRVPYIFDLRGMYPEESVNAGRYDMDSPDYRFWKELEKKLIASSRSCVVVSQPFVEHVFGIEPSARAEFIPCCVDPGTLGIPGKARTKERYGLGSRFVLLHLGSFGTPGDRGLAGKYLLRFRKIRPDAILVVASGTPAFGPAIERALQDEGLDPGDYRIYHPRGPELAEMLALGDAGLILERKVANTKVCLSVKLGEYLASGLPVICTPHAEGVVRLLEGYRCGLAVDPDMDPPLDGEREFLRHYRELQENGLRLVDEVLSLQRCSARWRETIEQELFREQE
jgi:glycosyltransferase involved in cell wall biosynthesis